MGENAKLRAVAKKSEANVAVLGDLQGEALAIKMALADLLPVAKNAQGVGMDAERKIRSLEMESQCLRLKKRRSTGI